MNARFGTDFDETDSIFFKQIEAELAADETLQKQAKANTLERVRYAFQDAFRHVLIERMGKNKQITQRILEDKLFGKVVPVQMM